MKEYNSSNTEMVLYSYSIGSVYILFWEIFISKRFFEALAFCHEVEINLKFIYKKKNKNILIIIIYLKHPEETYGRIALYSTVGYFGLNVVLTLVKQFGALVAVTGKTSAN